MNTEILLHAPALIRTYSKVLRMSRLGIFHDWIYGLRHHAHAQLKAKGGLAVIND